MVVASLYDYKCPVVRLNPTDFGAISTGDRAQIAVDGSVSTQV